MSPSPIVKTCGSCGRHYTRRMFIALPSLGAMSDGGGGRLDLRNCLCRSTLALPINPRGQRAAS